MIPERDLFDKMCHRAELIIDQEAKNRESRGYAPLYVYLDTRDTDLTLEVRTLFNIDGAMKPIPHLWIWYYPCTGRRPSSILAFRSMDHRAFCLRIDPEDEWCARYRDAFQFSDTMICAERFTAEKQVSMKRYVENVMHGVYDKHHPHWLGYHIKTDHVRANRHPVNPLYGTLLDTVDKMIDPIFLNACSWKESDYTLCQSRIRNRPFLKKPRPCVHARARWAKKKGD